MAKRDLTMSRTYEPLPADVATRFRRLVLIGQDMASGCMDAFTYQEAVKFHDAMRVLERLAIARDLPGIEKTYD